MSGSRRVLPLICLAASLGALPAAAQWQRLQRVPVYDAPRCARYPSIATTADGSLLVMFTRQSAAQPVDGQGDLMLAHSSDRGNSWSMPRTVYASPGGEPRAAGTLTRLTSGALIAPFAVLDDRQATSRFRLLASADGGRHWTTRDPQVDVPLAWWAPRGKLIETADGMLTMAVYGATTRDRLKRTVHQCGLLRSRDGGQTWGGYSVVTHGSRPVIGAADASRFSFEGPSLAVLPDGRWLAVVTARRLNAAGDGPSPVNAGPGSPQLLCRLWSRDQGRSWSPPDQLMPGAWPAVAVAGRHTLCVNTLWCGWGEMRLEISRNGFDSFFQEARMMTREWTRGMANQPQETPLPPTVPFLADRWPYEHYGYPSAVALDPQNVVVVFTDQQRGTTQIDGPQASRIPYDRERIQTVFYRRHPATSRDTPTPTKRPAGRWVLSERVIVPNLSGGMAQLPGGDLLGKVSEVLSRSSDSGRTWRPIGGATTPEQPSALGVLRSGRWLVATVQVNQEWKSKGGPQCVGKEGGYPTFRLTGESYDASIVVHYSDNEGQTWRSGPAFKGPMQWALPSVSHFIESGDGRVALPIFGCVTDEEMSSYSASNGVIRSRDGGKTWGDFSFVFRTQGKGPGDLQPEPRYSEMDIVQLSGGEWVACSRNERITMGPAGWGANDLASSTDRGRTWTKTGGTLVGVSQQKGLALPHGGFALTWRATSWQSSGVAISYDRGRSFDYLLTGPYETINAFVIDDDHFVVFTAKSHRSDSSAGVYRWVPGE